MRSFSKGVQRLQFDLPGSGVGVVLPQHPAHRETKLPPPFPLFFLNFHNTANKTIISFLGVSELSVSVTTAHSILFHNCVQHNSLELTDSYFTTLCSLPRRWLNHCLKFREIPLLIQVSLSPNFTKQYLVILPGTPRNKI